MIGVRRDRTRNSECACINLRCVGKSWAAGRQRSGLVERDRVDLGEAFERRAVLDHDAILEQAARGHDLHDRYGKPERTGTGDDQHRDGDRDARGASRRWQPSSRGRSRNAAAWTTGE